VQTILARFKIIPGKEKEAEEAIQKMAAAVQAKEPGALTYIFHRNRKEPAEITVFEVYRDDDAFTNHTSTDHMGEFRSHFASLFDPSAVQIERLERVAGFNRGE
jgi:quinol monooxygenase YgiN